ncbi:Ni/Fe hydrogenase subunit alpha [Sorangium cellulosum]|uniref:Ni/Fe hydrogenase subunit alpha n=1 Tax=Sorangium cellulosum TaxID=56 RepID=A0A4P2Q4W9_SORCE|nr:Ni/Fe hydrogenase subunit alpha [Sorangium cellulosum]AUX24241.1 Ni/Fe hydrogenase subunit alpha [Sorangium cellulosum]
MSAEERVYKVDVLTRVEGEGSFYLRARGGAVLEARLAIFEAPRFFEALLRGRGIHEVPDIVARICGICPVAYQMSAVRAIEGALGLAPSEPVRRLRRLLYCGEWIESHALHVFLLHAPDFLGYPSAIEMAKDHKDVVERGLAMKKVGNALVALLGGRAIHPVSPRLGGFTRAPRRRELARIRDDLRRACDQAIEAVRWTAALPAPDFEQDYVFVALAGGDAYPLEWGDRIAITGRPDVPVEQWEQHFVERQVPHSTALQCRLADGSPYLCGPMARLAHHAGKLHPRAAEALRESGIAAPGSLTTNPFRSIVVRAVEIVHALAEAIDLVDGYEEPDRPYDEVTPRDAVGFGATEAPRGLLWHRYAMGADGLVREARIVPPTSQNQARIERDLAGIAGELLALDHGAATRRCEQLIRAYDPCISCSTHFLKLTIDREGGSS